MKIRFFDIEFVARDFFLTEVPNFHNVFEIRLIFDYFGGFSSYLLALMRANFSDLDGPEFVPRRD